MKKNLLAVSIAAMIGGLGFAGAASAAVVIPSTGSTVLNAPPASTLAVTPEGVGHILLVPYFTTQAGNVSLLNIVNTDTVNGKAIKLRYRGAANSDDLYDVTLLLSPGDVWSAEVSQQDGISVLKTVDNSCTLPANINASFSTERVRGNLPSETLEGYIEILNMADIPPRLADTTGAVPTTGTLNNALYNAIKHNAAGTPNCAGIPNQMADLAEDGDNAWNTRGYNFPTGGLMANWSIVNLSKSGSFTGDATAIQAVDATGATGAGNIVFSPQDNAELAGGAASAFTADPLFRRTRLDGSPVLTMRQFDAPDLSTPYVTAAVVGADPALEQANALSGALSTLSVSNEYMTSPAVGFATDWTFSSPTRRYHVAMDYAAETTAARLVAQDTADQTYYRTTGNSAGANTRLSADGTQICVNPGANSLTFFDTSERQADGGSYVISPQPTVPGLTFCGETSVLTFNNAGESVLGAAIARQNIVTRQNASTTFTDGWMRINTPNNVGAGVNLGLPIVGHAFAKALGVSSSLGGIWKHRMNQRVQLVTVNPLP